MKVNWENAPEDAMYAAQDSDGSIKFYEAKPHPNEHSWSAENGDTWYAFGEVSDWRNSLTARNSCDPSQKNESKQIEEVMALVKDYTKEALQFYGWENGGSHDSMNSAWSAIAAKLRELLPVWQPIESAIKQEGELIWAFNGEQAAMRYTKTPDGDLWCWLDEALSDIDPEPQQPTHWMPLPKAPE